MCSEPFVSCSAQDWGEVRRRYVRQKGRKEAKRDVTMTLKLLDWAGQLSFNFEYSRQQTYVQGASFLSTSCLAPARSLSSAELLTDKLQYRKWDFSSYLKLNTDLLCFGFGHNGAYSQFVMEDIHSKTYVWPELGNSVKSGIVLWLPTCDFLSAMFINLSVQSNIIVSRYWTNVSVAPGMVTSVCTCEVEGKGDKAVVFAEDAERLLPLHQREEVIRHRLTIEEVVHTQQEVPAGWRGGTKCTHLTA